MKESELSVDVGALQQDAEYFAKRQLKRGSRLVAFSGARCFLCHFG